MSKPEGSEVPQVPPPPGAPSPAEGSAVFRPLPDPDSAPPTDPGQRHARGDTPSTAFWVPWTWLEAIGVVVIAQLIAIVLLSLIAAFYPERLETLQAPLSGLTFALATVGWVAVRHRGDVGRLLGPVRPAARHLLTGVGYGIGGFVVVVLGFGSLLQFVADRLGIELPPVQEQLNELAQNPETLPFLAIAVIAMAPIGEELFFRGLLFQALRRRLHLWPAIGLSGVAFALVHLEPLAMLTVFPLGMWFAWIFHRSGSLLVPVVAHAIFNAITLGAMLAAPRMAQTGI